MRAIIIGYPYAGKTVFFDAISGAVSNDIQKNSCNIRNIKVSDKRLAKLKDIFNPKKYTPAEINVFDNFTPVSEFGKENTIFTRNTIENIQKSEVTVLVVRAFDDSNAPYFKEKIEPFKDFKTIIEEMCFLDLISAEKKIERLKKENSKSKELEIISRCYDNLQNNNTVFNMNLTEDETSQLSGFKFLTQNRIMLVLNTGDNPDKNEIKQIELYAEEKGINYLSLNAKIEFEISQFETDAEKLEFLKDYGLSEPVVDRFVSKVYEMMGLISFFTVGPDEVKAWTIRKDTSALKAAGKIHTDIQRGFIRAEILDSELFFSYSGNMLKIKNEGKLRLEGKEYIVKDGEIINFRFNV